ncbi:MAG: hypothetical protein A2428_12430 [Bdellovibrionales bacterium RIFOXYC1_FULL_54_43]|nr:MAG: hypothetical protein A2428_12430 [Bdellovibrionales bacterium RIFOXYC1_FULL_54_43]OFZ80055.1 MAG: hypothetical protein A2603_17200 [Bdellovibrionales bacterium RIFOXYD1_FULL_55_31]
MCQVSLRLNFRPARKFRNSAIQPLGFPRKGQPHFAKNSHHLYWTVLPPKAKTGGQKRPVCPFTSPKNFPKTLVLKPKILLKDDSDTSEVFFLAREKNG